MAIRLREGRWGLSRIVSDSDGFTTAASRAVIGVQNYYPPMNPARSGFSLPFALVRFPEAVAQSDADTRLIPPLVLDGTLRDLSGAQRTALRSQLEEWMTGYSFRDWDGVTVVKQTFSGAGYTLDTPLRQILLDLYGHLGHSDARPRPTIRETHNTEFLDNFSTDPYSAPRWTNERGAHVWDSGNSELDLVMSVANPYARYSVNGPGSGEHEAQVTNVVNSSLGDAGSSGAVRCDNAGVDDYYFCWVGAGTTLHLGYILAGSRATLTTFSFTYTSGNFVTIRMAAAGAVGANVVLDIWRNHHGSSKPSDPGWFGPDGTPDHTYTDTAVDRLDAASHVHCGIGGRSQGADYDTRCCFWKSRAISDRAGGAPKSLLPLTPFGKAFPALLHH